jgi:hypothetical protein
MRDLMKIVHKISLSNARRAELVRMRNKWVPIDPRQWKTRSDMTVAVGLGTGDKSQQLQHLVTILQAQREAIQIGVASPKNIYNALAKLTQNAGFRNVEEFWTDPDTVPPQQPKPDPEQMKLQADVQKFQAQTQMEQAKQQAQMQASIIEQKAQMEQKDRELQMMAQRDSEKAQLDAQLEQMKAQNEYQLEQQRLAFEKWKAQLDSETKIYIANLNANIEQTKISTDMLVKESDMERQERIHKEKIDAMTRPKTIIRDESGRASGVA